MLRKTLTTTVLTAALTLGIASAANAAIIDLATFSFDGTAGSLNSGVNPDDATVSVFGPGPNTQGAAFGFASRFGVNYAYWIPDGNGDPGGTGDGVYTSADNLADGEYMTFTITADAGFKLNLNDIDFRASRNGGSGTINQLDLYVSVNDGAFTKVGDTLSLSDSSNPGTTTRDLADVTFQNIQKAQFAFVFFNGSKNRGYLDDIVLSGEVIPEPASLALLGLGSLLMLGRGRFRGRREA